MLAWKIGCAAEGVSFQVHVPKLIEPVELVAMITSLARRNPVS